MNELEKLYTGIVLRGTSVELHSDVGQKFLTALCRRVRRDHHVRRFATGLGAL